MTTKLRKHLLLVAGIITGIAALFLQHKDRETYICQSCFAKNNVFQWRLGAWHGFSLPLTPRWEQVSETHFRQDFLPEEHAHDWKFAQGSPYYFFGTTWGGCALGSGRHTSNLLQMYEFSPEFRVFIEKRIQDGTLAKSDFIALASFKGKGEASGLQKDADALLNAFLAQ